MATKSTKSSGADPDVCEKCEGTGYVLLDTGATPCECTLRRLAEQKYGLAKIPRKFVNKDISGFAARNQRQKEILQAAKAFM